MPKIRGNKMKIVVTGSEGFVGSHLVEVLVDLGYDVLGIDKKDNCDISHFGQLNRLISEFKPEIVIHLAASCSTSKSINDPKSDFTDNVVGTFNVIEACRKNGAKLHYTSSIKAFNGSPYGVSKGVGELYLWEYLATYGLEFIINRPGTIYGPRQDGSEDSGWIGHFIKSKLEGKKVQIFGSGEQVRDLLYVMDYVRLIITQIEAWNRYKNQLYEVGGGEYNAVGVKEMADYLKLEYDLAPSRPRDNERFVSLNLIDGWKPKVGYKEGIKETIKYYKELI